MYKLNKRSSILLTLGVVFILASWVLSFSFGYALKDYFIKPRDGFLLGQSVETYFVMIVAFVLCGISLILYSLENLSKNKKQWLGLPLLIVSLVLFFIAYDSYYYADKRIIANNDLLSFEKQEYRWSEIKKMEKIYHVIEGGSEKAVAIVMYPKNGEKPIKIEWSDYIFYTQYRLESLVRDHGGEVKTVIIDTRK